MSVLTPPIRRPGVGGWVESRSFLPEAVFAQVRGRKSVDEGDRFGDRDAVGHELAPRGDRRRRDRRRCRTRSCGRRGCRTTRAGRATGWPRPLGRRCASPSASAASRKLLTYRPQSTAPYVPSSTGVEMTARCGAPKNSKLRIISRADASRSPLATPTASYSCQPTSRRRSACTPVYSAGNSKSEPKPSPEVLSASASFVVASPDVITTCHGWVLHHEAVCCAAESSRSITSRGTCSSRKPRHDRRCVRIRSRPSTSLIDPRIARRASR